MVDALQAPETRSPPAGGRWASESDPTGPCLWRTLTSACLRSTPPQVSVRTGPTTLPVLLFWSSGGSCEQPLHPCWVTCSRTAPSLFFSAGEATQLVTGGQVVAGRKLSFINDVAVTQDGKKVYFTDSSSRWQRRDYLHLIMEATPDGRYEFTSLDEFGNKRSRNV